MGNMKLDKKIQEMEKQLAKHEQEKRRAEEASNASVYIYEKTRELRSMFKGISKETDDHLKTLIGEFLSGIDGY